MIQRLSKPGLEFQNRFIIVEICWITFIILAFVFLCDLTDNTVCISYIVFENTIPGMIKGSDLNWSRGQWDSKKTKLKGNCFKVFSFPWRCSIFQLCIKIYINFIPMLHDCNLSLNGTSLGVKQVRVCWIRSINYVVNNYVVNNRFTLVCWLTLLFYYLCLNWNCESKVYNM